MVAAMRRTRTFSSRPTEAAWCRGAHDAPFEMALYAKAKEKGGGEYILPFPVRRVRAGNGEIWINHKHETHLDVEIVAWRTLGGV